MKLSIREATTADAHNIASVHVASWQTTYRGILPQPLLDSLDVEARTWDWNDWLRRDGVTVYVADDAEEPVTALCGFIAGGPIREPLEDFDAEVYAIYLLSSAQGQGAGSLLLQRFAQTLLSRGFQKAAVWVLADNPACRFYQHLGATQLAQKLTPLGDAEFAEAAYGWHDLATLLQRD